MTYKEIVYEIIEDINNGVLLKGSKIPSEAQLSEKYECNRHTIRKSIDLLIEKGYLRKEHKGPTFVNENLKDYGLSLGSLYDLYIPQEINTKVLSLEKIIPPCEVSKKLKLKEGEEVWFIKRVREINGVPHHLENTFMPYKLFDDLNLNRCLGSILNYIEEKDDFIISHGIKTIKGIQLDEENSKLLELEKGTVTLLIENVGFLTNGRIYEYSICIHRDNNMSYYARK
ncbi:MAG: GntR family transcriptional regulator [Clostridium sp.]